METIELSRGQKKIKLRQDGIAAMEKALAMPMDRNGKELFKRDEKGVPELKKYSLTTASNLTTYDLRDPSLHLIPFLSPLRDSLPRVDKSAKAGTTAHWKTIFAASLVQGGYQADPWINEGQRAPEISYSASDESANYVTIGTGGSVTFEAQAASAGMEDANSTTRFFALENQFTREEDALIGGNNSLKLGTCGTVTVSAPSLPTSTLPTTTYYVSCVQLTYGGYRNSSVTGGVATQKVIVTPDGLTMTVNGGSGMVSASSAGQAVTVSTTALGASVTAKAGAVAYAWYVGTSNSLGAQHLQQITTVPSMTQSVPLVTTTQLASAITQDLSVNDGTTGGQTGQVTAFDGFLTQCQNAAALGNAYVNNLNGGTLTSTGKGGVAEIDAVNVYLWNTFKAAVTKIYVNAQELTNITTKVLNGSSAPLLRYTRDGNDAYNLTAGGTISYYFNPYIPVGDMQKIEIVVHPTIPPGTMLLYAEHLPAYFKTNATPTVAEVLCRRDYYSVDFAQTGRFYPFGIFSEEVLAIYAPFCVAMITNIANG